MEQSAPVNPSKQVHTAHGVVHFPFPEHELGQGVYLEAWIGFEEMTAARKYDKMLQNRRMKLRYTKVLDKHGRTGDL